MNSARTTNDANIQVPIFNQVLKPIGSDEFIDLYYRNLVASIVSSLKREEHILFSLSSGLDQDKLAEFLSYIVYSLFPASISLIEKDGSWNLIRHEASENDNEQRPLDDSNENVSPYLSNIVMIKNFNEKSDSMDVLKIIKQLYITIDEENIQVPVPFVVFAFVSENSYLTHYFLQTFSLHIHLTSIPSSIPHVESSLYPTYDHFLQATNHQIFLSRDLLAFFGQIILKIDCSPLITSYIEGKTKLLIQKASEDQAILCGRNFIIPDDIQNSVPVFLQSSAYSLIPLIQQAGTDH